MGISDSVTGFEDLLADSFAKFYNVSSEIGGLIKEQCLLVKLALDTELGFVRLASESQKPVDDVMKELLQPISELINQILAIREKNRDHEYFNLLSSIAAGIPALGWVSVSPTPAPYIKEMINATQFYTNRILKSYKNTNQTLVNWANLWIEFLSQLEQYVRKNHTTGLTWNNKGQILDSVNKSTQPPPPPPPPADFFNENSSDDKNGSGSRAALLASINKGVEITKGLRKVTLDHKNESPKQSNLSSEPKTSAKSSSSIVHKQAKMELQGKRWIVENQYEQKNLIISNTEMTQVINIFNCKDSVLTVKGKVNLITVTQCNKFSIIFDNIVSVVEFINSQRLQAQVTGIVPTITIDKVDGIEIYLSKESLSCEIVSSKSSEINISIQNASGEYVEYPLPDQFKSIWNGNGFKTIAMEKN